MFYNFFSLEILTFYGIFFWKNSILLFLLYFVLWNSILSLQLLIWFGYVSLSFWLLKKWQIFSQFETLFSILLFSFIIILFICSLWNWSIIYLVFTCLMIIIMFMNHFLIWYVSVYLVYCVCVCVFMSTFISTCTKTNKNEMQWKKFLTHTDKHLECFLPEKNCCQLYSLLLLHNY